MMEFLNILKEGKEYKEQVYALYETAFPKEEQKPISYMEKWAEEGKAELLAVVEEREFICLAMNMFSSSAAVLDYFAISPEKRSGGYGGKAVWGELLAVVEEREFICLAMNMFSSSAAVLDYFAISPEKRSGGYGGKAVWGLVERFKGQKYVFEIEKQDELAENAEDRKRRKAFYKKRRIWRQSSQGARGTV